MAREHNGRCHWGQYFSPQLDNAHLVNAFSEKSVNSFVSQIKKFDPNGLMSNELTKKLGLTPSGEIHSNANFDFSSTSNDGGDNEGGEGTAVCERIKKILKLIWTSFSK